MARILVTEKIADGGLDRLRQAGHDVVVELEPSPDELARARGHANALIIRSSTQVTREVLEAGTELVVVGRAGIGLDNVDVAAATERGVMVVNAPQSNVLSAAEHTMALLLAQARNIPQAHAALVEGRWERSRWTGVELSDKTLGVVGLGRIGKLVAQRALAFGMRLVAFDPFVAPERARQMNVELVEPRRVDGGRRLRHAARGQDTRDDGADQRRTAGQGQARDPHRQRGTGRHRRRGGAGRSDRTGATSPARRSTCSRPSPARTRRCSDFRAWWSRRTSGPAPRRRRTRRA